MGTNSEEHREEIACPAYRGPDRREETKEHWHTSKSVPISIIFAILVQTIMLIIWASTFRAEFVAHEKRAAERFTSLEDRMHNTYDKDTLKAHLQLRDQKIETVNTNITAMATTLNRMYDKVDKKLDECDRRMNK